jgi:hypothetical protein
VDDRNPGLKRSNWLGVSDNLFAMGEDLELLRL